MDNEPKPEPVQRMMFGLPPKQRKPILPDSAKSVIRTYLSLYKKDTGLEYNMGTNDWFKAYTAIKSKVKAGYTYEDLINILKYLFVDPKDNFMLKVRMNIHSALSDWVISQLSPEVKIWQDINKLKEGG